jgi:hypothetical protein
MKYRGRVGNVADLGTSAPAIIMDCQAERTLLRHRSPIVGDTSSQGAWKGLSIV